MVVDDDDCRGIGGNDVAEGRRVVMGVLIGL